uniref:Uncharacterized protein n=1 Tax=Meloidogyne enterolobii TaxID=390850 RepID=A0A6V7UA64_MELEN|nr:unnamed protein product [Meloidogyne enterolobii]
MTNHFSPTTKRVGYPEIFGLDICFGSGYPKICQAQLEHTNWKVSKQFIYSPEWSINSSQVHICSP